MSINKTYAVFGLGRYGMAVSRELVNNGIEVLAVDSNEAVVNSAATELPICRCADVTDPEVIRQLGISNIDVVIVAMANNLEASVLAVTLCKDIGVKRVIAKCGSEMQKKILSRVGADEVVFPENESGTRLAKNLLSSGFIDAVTLSRDFAMTEIDVREDWIGKSLLELNLRKRFSMNVVALRRGERLNVNIDPEDKIKSGDKLIVIASTAKLATFRRK
ncbi:MAG: TrkA family potassium uptake protein [Clostridia bacterium]|nr:TrkA family potassium uptake protein [Clostridia bacterium]